MSLVHKLVYSMYWSYGLISGQSWTTIRWLVLKKELRKVDLIMEKFFCSIVWPIASNFPKTDFIYKNKFKEMLKLSRMLTKKIFMKMLMIFQFQWYLIEQKSWKFQNRRKKWSYRMWSKNYENYVSSEHYSECILRYFLRIFVKSHSLCS